MRTSLLAATLLIACKTGDDPLPDNTPTPAPPTPDCVPAQDAFDLNVSSILADKCSECHGATPQFGAPYSLLEYDDLIEGAEGERKIDRVVITLVNEFMPPSNAPALTHVELDTLLGWASCGLEHPEEPSGVVVDREIWEAGPTPPPGAIAIDLTVDQEVVDIDDIDDYREFTFSNLVNEPMFIQRIEPVIDESRVLHHITLTRSIGFPYLYAWAPGTGPIEFPDGGMAIGPGDSFTVQIHYNNGAGIPDAVDSSGIRIWVGDNVGTLYGMASPQSWNIFVPAGEQQVVTHTCVATSSFNIIAGMPHMHKIGSTFEHTVERSNGTIESLVTLSGWSFESQYFYEINTHINAGDTLRMRCGYDNPGTTAVIAGQGTDDEMCFNFLVVEPASAATQCIF